MTEPRSNTFGAPNLSESQPPAGVSATETSEPRVTASSASDLARPTSGEVIRLSA